MPTGRKSYDSNMELCYETPRSKKEQRRRRKSSAGQASTTTPTNAKESDEKYQEVGISPPQNPSNGTKLSYDEAVESIRNGFFGDEISKTFDDLDDDSKKRLLYHAGRSFGEDFSKEKRVNMMKEMHGLSASANEEEKELIAKRFDIMLGRQEDRDLFNEMVGAEASESLYTNTGEATGITHGDNYDRQVLAIHRYAEQYDTFRFISSEKIQDHRFFFRWNRFGTCYVTSACVLASYLGQMAFGDGTVVHPPDTGKLMRSFEDDAQYEYIVNHSGGDPTKILRKMIERLDNKSKAYLNSFEANFPIDFANVIRETGLFLVTNFHVSKNFNYAWNENPLWEKNMTNNEVGASAKDHIGIIRFDMKEGQTFETVKGEFIELKAPRGTDLTLADELNNIRKSSVQEENGNCQSWEDLYKKPRRKKKRGDVSAHRYFPNTSPENIRPCPRYDGISVRLVDTDHFEESFEERDGSEESFEERDGSEVDQTEVPDSPPESDDESAKEVTHWMICIGGREVDGKLFLLLQNSWARMPLVEVSLAYCRAAEAHLSILHSDHIECFRSLKQKDKFYKFNKAIVADCSSN